MNLRGYYQKLREVERSLVAPFIVLASQETPDGGREGTLTEASRQIAARMIVEGRALVATEEQVRAFQEAKTEAKRLAEQEAAVSKMQVTVVQADPRATRGVRPKE